MGFTNAQVLVPLVIASIAALPSGQQRRGPIPGAVAAQVGLDTGRIELPIDLETRRPMIQMYIDGSGPYWFVVDTGASPTLIDNALAQELGLPVNGTQRVRSPGGPGIDASVFGSETLISGALRIEGAGLLGVDLAAMTDLFQGVLGMSHFEELLVTFDYPGSRLIVSSGTLSAEQAGAVAFDPRARFIRYEIDVAGVTLPVDLDTGSPGGFMLPKAFEDRWKFASPVAEAEPARLIGAEHPTWRATLDGDIVMAGISFTNPEVRLSEFTSDFANVGYEVIRDLVVTIDRGNGLVRFEAPQTAPVAATTAPTNGPVRAPRGAGDPPRMGIAFQMTPGGLVIANGGVAVRLVEVGGGAAAAGIRVGDVLTIINDKSVADMDMSEFGRLMRSVRPLHMRLLRGSDDIDVTIEG